MSRQSGLAHHQLNGSWTTCKSGAICMAPLCRTTYSLNLLSTWSASLWRKYLPVRLPQNSSYRSFSEVIVSIASADSTPAPVSATATIPYGSSSASFSGTAGVAAAQTSIVITARLSGVSASGTLTISAASGAVIQATDYWSISKLMKVTATTSVPSGTLTWGTSPTGPSVGMLALETTTGLHQGSASISQASGNDGGHRSCHCQGCL